MERRIQLDDKHTELERQTYNLFPERWGQVYREELFPGLTKGRQPGDYGEAFGDEREMPVTNFDEITAWTENLNAPRRMSGAQAGGDDMSRYLGYAEGVGRRV